MDRSKNITPDQQEEKDAYEDYEPDWKDLQAHEEALAEWKKIIQIGVMKMQLLIMVKYKVTLKEESSYI